MSNKFINKPNNALNTDNKGRYEYLSIRENPFPSTPFVNKDSEEKKQNGSIYEPSIRAKEYKQILDNFLVVPQQNSDHLRLGFILDKSYIGRGNGKSSFIINLMNNINKEYCLDLSNNVNKCFAIYFSPESGGKTKVFDKFLDILFKNILDSGILNESLAMLRLDAIFAIYQSEFILSNEFVNDEDIVNKLNDNNWFGTHLFVNKNEVTNHIYSNTRISNLLAPFPLAKNKNFVLEPIVTQMDFLEYYKTLKRSEDKLNFLFSDLVTLFIESGFNGSFIFVDDFERIPEFQSTIQKKDFCSQLRTILFDGTYLNSRVGFYNFILSLHAGVPRILQEEWATSGLEQRASLSSTASHLIIFDRITENDVIALISKYLREYRVDNYTGNELLPFNKEAIKIIGNRQEMNASKILKLCYELIEHSVNNSINMVDEEVVQKYLNTKDEIKDEEHKSIVNTKTINLQEKSNE